MAANHQVFFRRWESRRPRPPTTRDDFRSIIDDVIITRPEVLHSDDDETRNSSHETIHSAENTDSTSPNAERTKLTNLTGPGVLFRVLSWNVLTDNCVRDGQYLYCPPEIRYMDSRHGRIMAELRALDPDVVCLQEADEQHFRKRLQPEIETLGYSGVNQGTTDEQGLATFWRASVFELVKWKAVLLTDAINGYLERNAFTDASKRSAIEAWSRRPEVTLIVHLRHLATGRNIAICNNHVGWMGLRYPTLQALQVAVALRQLVELADPVTSSLVFCGDLNSPPSFPAYRLLSRGRLSRKAFERFCNEYSYVDETDRQNFSTITDAIPDIFQLPLQLESSYVSVLGREPSVTNCDGAHADGLVKSFCLDYIWYWNLEPIRVLETPSLSVVTEEVALPNTRFPSDHISIAVEFTLK